VLGVFDSGVGGLSIWREIASALPEVPVVYLADQAFVPYGDRSPEEVRARVLRLAGWLIQHGCALVVVACNTASAVALDALRAEFHRVPFVGIEPAVKPAAQHTQTGTIAVLATHNTLRSQRYAGLVNRWGGGVRVLERACPAWVKAVERLDVYQRTPHLLTFMVKACVWPLLEQRADVLVLGCTHFPFLRPWIDQVAARWRAAHANAPPITIYDPAPAVARRTHQVWRGQVAFGSTGAGQFSLPCASHHEFWTTGEAAGFATVAQALLGYPIVARQLKL
jgi:glutamate racemase